MVNKQRVDGQLNELALFAGAGGGILGGHLLGWCTVCAVELDAYAASVLLARQNDKILPPFPVWDDVCTFDGRPWRGIVDVISGGFPCQDISVAGKGAGITGERSGLWKEFARIIGEVRPQYVFVENSPMLTVRGLDVVLGDLAALGYDAEWGVLGAHHVGASHKRDRIWILAYTTGTGARKNDDWLWAGIGGNDRGETTIMADPESLRGRPGLCQDGQKQNGNQLADGGGNVPDAKSRGRGELRCTPREAGHVDGVHENIPDTNGQRLEKQREPITTGTEYAKLERCHWWESEPDVGRVAHGLAARVDRLKAIGNGQVPLVAATAWQILTSAPE